ncbi:chaperonin-like RBCX protein 1, chloroplastic [Momordica charantia]|uniref:Chaperonin-like RBCX protein 1, chloroplastic n=1 Tax=Momordica charantia TaxID=3673 RepID=A0A6J1BTL5_MOMCH|nr:chaperonin-like RBCX protein 1, chloroplastic [Momordica charantia]
MESSARVLSPTQFPSLFPLPNLNRSRVFPLWPTKPKASKFTRLQLQCHKMYVPGFGEASPEAKAAKNLHNFFTYVAVRIVIAQLESYNPEAHVELMEFLDRHSLNDGDKFLASLMRESSRHKSLALRILEVRSAYCKNDFEWDNLKRLASKMASESNTRLMREYVTETSPSETEK